MNVCRPDREEGTETEIVGCGRSVPEFDEDGCGVVFGEEFEAAGGGLGHFAFDGEVVDVGYTTGEGCEVGAGGEGAERDGGVGLGGGPLE